MATSKRTKTYLIENNEYYFNVDAFRRAFDEYRNKLIKETGEKITAESIRERINEKIHYNSETIKKWYQGSNSPADIAALESIASFFDIDYMSLVVRKEQRVMNKDTFTVNEGEKEVINAVYQKIVDICMLEAYRYKGSMYGTEYYENEDFWSEREKLGKEAYEIVDRNSLNISSVTRNKLYNLLAEMKLSLGGYEYPAARWVRLNPLYQAARTLLKDGECNMDEEEIALRDDIEANFECPYEIYNPDEGIHYRGYHKGTSIEEALNEIYEPTNKKYKKDDVIFQPYRDSDASIYEPEEIFKFEYLKTINLILREDFPEYYPD